jgi:hypothetical protein
LRSFLIALSAASAIFLSVCAFSPAATLAPNAKEMAPLHYLIGTWHCSGAGIPAEDQVFEEALGGAWLQEKEVVTGSDGQPKTVSIHYTGYDPATAHFMHVGPDVDGSYELASSVDGDVWHDSNDASSTFTHTKVSDTARTMRLNFMDKGKPASLLMTCKKAQ